MPLTEKDVRFEEETAGKIFFNPGKFDVKSLKYKVNSVGRPMLYTKGRGKRTETLDFEYDVVGTYGEVAWWYLSYWLFA